MAGLAARDAVTVEVSALTSAPYVELTLAAIAELGGVVERPAPDVFRVQPALLGGEVSGRGSTRSGWKAISRPPATRRRLRR